MINPNDENQNPFLEEESDIKKYIFLILSNWYWFVLSIFMGLFISYLVNRYSVNVYSLQSFLIIRDDENSRGISGAENLIPGLRLTRNTKSIQNEIGVLKSYSIAYKVVSQLEDFKITYVRVGRRGIVKRELYNQSPFIVQLDSTKNNIADYPVNITILSKDKYLVEIDDSYNIKKEVQWGENFNSEPFNFKLKIRNPDIFAGYSSGVKFYFTINSINNLANDYKSKVSIDLNDKKGSILSLTTSGTVPEMEADYLNALMKTYLQIGLDEKNMIADNTIRFIDSQLTDMTDSLHRAEIRLQNFRTENRIIDISNEATSISTKIMNLENEKGTSELKARYYLYLEKYLKERRELKDIVAPSAMGVDDVLLSKILEDLSSAYIEQEGMMLSANPSTPGLNSFSYKLETLKKTLEEKVKSLIEVNKVELGEINRRMEEFEREMIKIPMNERLLIGFEREFNLINKMYTYMNEKRAEAAIAKASNIADNKILDYALPENAVQIKPNRKMIYINGLFAGILIPLVIIFSINFFNTKITDIKDIVDHTTAPIVGLIGHNGYNTELPVALKPKSTLAESFRGLRTNLSYILREPDKKVVIVTSTVSGEGKTFFASNLALIIALNGKKVLLIGLDLRKPKMNKLFDISSSSGLSTYLIGRDDFNSIVCKSKYDNLYVVPSGPVPPNPAELVGSAKMDEFILEARKHFDYIIIDTPPIAIVTDALLATRFADATLFVVRFNHSEKEVVNLVEHERASERNKNIALVINDFVAMRRYGYSYGYGIKYGSQYFYKESHGYYESEKRPMTMKEKIVKFFS